MCLGREIVDPSMSFFKQCCNWQAAVVSGKRKNGKKGTTRANGGAFNLRSFWLEFQMTNMFFSTCLKFHRGNFETLNHSKMCHVLISLFSEFFFTQNGPFSKANLSKNTTLTKTEHPTRNIVTPPPPCCSFSLSAFADWIFFQLHLFNIQCSRNLYSLIWPMISMQFAYSSRMNISLCLFRLFLIRLFWKKQIQLFWCSCWFPALPWTQRA